MVKQTTCSADHCQYKRRGGDTVYPSVDPGYRALKKKSDLVLGREDTVASLLLNDFSKMVSENLPKG